MIDRAQHWADSVDWTDRDRVLEQLTRTNALVVPDEAQARNLHLLDAT